MGTVTSATKEQHDREFMEKKGILKKEKGISDSLKEKHPDLDFSLQESKKEGRPTVLSRVVVDKKKRGEGQGSKFMEDLLAHADERGHTLALTPSSDFGGSVPRLNKFYGRYGFVPNKGKHKDYSISEGMYRHPQTKGDKKE
jgi:GNAT superfamily N-acetyltransferase